jgi:iron complex transport system ATP-binding protein
MLLRADNLSYGHPGRTLGRHIELTVAAGEALCIVGPNGSGKTTLLRTLLGLLPAHAGQVLLGERPLAAWPRTQLARLLAYVPQAHAGTFPYSVEEVVLMGRTAHMGLFAAPSAADRSAARAALATLRIESLADKVYTRISGGERQLTLIARALAQGAQILVLDEPTVSLDFGNRSRVLGELAALSRRGIGVLFSTHHPDEAFLCAQHVIMLRDGEVHIAGTPREVITAPRLRELYGVDVTVVDLPDGSGRACMPALPVRPTVS